MGISNGRRVVNVRETVECRPARQLVVAVGDFHTAVDLSDGLAEKQHNGLVLVTEAVFEASVALDETRVRF